MAKKSVKNANSRFERNLNKAPENYMLRLYVTGATPRSCRAVANLKSICDDYLVGCFQLEVIDIYQYPELARDERIIAAPTLIKSFPLPRQVMVGDLSNQDLVRKKLGIVS